MWIKNHKWITDLFVALAVGISLGISIYNCVQINKLSSNTLTKYNANFIEGQYQELRAAHDELTKRLSLTLPSGAYINPPTKEDTSDFKIQEFMESVK